MGGPMSTAIFKTNISLVKTDNGIKPSDTLVGLLVSARQNYDWPAGTGKYKSQQKIISLENDIEAKLVNLNPISAHQIVVDVSDWAGNNKKSQNAICSASDLQQNSMMQAIKNLIVPANSITGIKNLCTLPGISLVISSKIFRFCCPTVGVSLDRHASYFFNSLAVMGGKNSTEFYREWANGKHTTSRLAIYSDFGLKRNRDEYFAKYLPLLKGIADSLNSLSALYLCAVTGKYKEWYPADVEMAAYYWWACNGAR